MDAKKAIKKAFEVQIKGLGTGFVEILASCPTKWKMDPIEAHNQVKNVLYETFVPQVFRDLSDE